ncbi:hypothetical protein [Nocardioides sp.]|uniref:hypothetical protein n=1 Tax=Nocardioides sp. TaxID=35761 RepID=UPI002734CB9D|nr:hypothetical protein [Nocardioides sp.]MDP3890079.1 hypothetical protein [Nocardioides sp.]
MTSRLLPRMTVAVACLTVVAACSTAPDPGGSPASTPAPAPTTPAPTTASPSSGRLDAELRQSSLDAARGQMQVWIHNDTGADVEPTDIRLRDPRLGRPVPGERLRGIPAGSQRGYPLRLPTEPDCAAPDRPGRLVVHDASGRLAVRLTDPHDIIGRHTRSRCLEVAVTRVAELRWADRVRRHGSGPDATADLVLVVEPSNGSGRFTLDEVNGTPVFTPVDGASWLPDRVVDAADGPVRVELPMKPARCDPHVFQESAGATAFRLHVTIDGESGSFVLRMSDRGARDALDFAVTTCGL